jgi:hypothetical protein
VVGGRDGHQAEAADAAAGVPQPAITMGPFIRTGLRRSSRMRSEREDWWPCGSVAVIKAATGCLRHPRADCGATRRPARRLSCNHRRSSRACVSHSLRLSATPRSISTVATHAQSSHARCLFLARPKAEAGPVSVKPCERWSMHSGAFEPFGHAVEIAAGIWQARSDLCDHQAWKGTS